MLQSQLYGRARDLCKAIPDSVIRSEKGAEAIVEALYKRDPLAVVSDVFQDFLSLMNTKRNQNESFKNFESRFQAQVSRLNSHGTQAKLSDALVAFALLANADEDNNRRVSLLANGAPRDSSLTATSTTNDYLKAVSYEAIASVLRQCDRMKNAGEEASAKHLSANAAHHRSRKGQRPMRTPQQLAKIKGKSKCHLCKKFGRWKSDHNKDGTLKPGVKALEAPSTGEEFGKGVLTFNMVSLGTGGLSQDFFRGEVGPLLNDGAPYSGIGSTEMKLIAELVCPEWNGEFDPIPTAIADRPYWQYGIGEHSSPAKKILGSVLFKARTDQGRVFHIRHLVIEGSSQWVVGRNVTDYCNILHINENTLELPPDVNGNSQGSIALMDQDMHTYIPHSVFTFRADGLTTEKKATLFCVAAHVNPDLAKRPWAELKKIVDRVHKHVCGHSTYSDIKLLLERNNLWNEHVSRYLQTTLEKCTACQTTAKPKASRKVSLSTMSRSFNEVVCVDHMFLDQQCVMHVMDATTRYSVGAVVEDTSMRNAAVVFDGHWLTSFWAPGVVTYDSEFKNSIFLKYLNDHGIDSRPLPPRRHNKNVLESKHRVIRDIFLRLKEDGRGLNEYWTQSLCAQQAIRISNDLYGNEVLSAQELAKGYSRPLESGVMPSLLPQDVVIACQTLLAKRKLTLILRSKSFEESPIAVGDLVQVFIKRQNEKRGKWSQDKPVLSYDLANRTVTVPGSQGRKICAAIEDIRPAIRKAELATAVQDAIDELDRNLDEVVEQLKSKTDDNEKDSEEHHKDNQLQSEEEPDCIGPNLPKVGDQIEVYWPIDKTFYGGTVAEHNQQTGKYAIHYFDGDKENLKLQDEIWNYAKNPPPSKRTGSHRSWQSGTNSRTGA